ncbi:hypothetical protein GW17_00047440 [Ensete ventricosum]|nr:hypothetical protein GW17_00047440 [Ensete ventricosum]
MDQVLAPLPIGFAVFMVHLATIPITGTGINPARSFGAAVIYNKDKAWDDQVHPTPLVVALTALSTYARIHYFFTSPCKVTFTTWSDPVRINLNAVDLLGGASHRCRHCRSLSPIHPKSRCCQSFGFFPEQCMITSRQMEWLESSGGKLSMKCLLSSHFESLIRPLYYFRFPIKLLPLESLIQK